MWKNYWQTIFHVSALAKLDTSASIEITVNNQIVHMEYLSADVVMTEYGIFTFC